MYIVKLPNAAAAMISVTSTATSIYNLIDTAASAIANLDGRNNAIDINVEDGDIRVLFDGNTPTASNGILLSSGVSYQFRGVPLTQMKLIRAGSANVSCSVQVGRSEVGEVSNAVAHSPVVSFGANGSAQPTVDSYSSVAIDEVTGANQQLIAAPGANKQIWVYGYSIVADTAVTTVELQDEDDTVCVSYAGGFAQYGGISVSPSGNFAQPLFKVATNKALEADVGTGSISGSLQYAIVSV